ncbi:MAG TPA: agmatinase, partial [Acidimicrobiales bacterium]|nr:agmatinase [Acidimicrobiales bacterium]
AVAGIPFDGGTTYRPGARFGPAGVREASRLLRPYHPGLGVEPFGVHQVVDAGDLTATPFSVDQAIADIETGAGELLRRGGALVAIGGDHTVSLPLLRATAGRHGPLALVHLDAHLDTWDTYLAAPYTHGTPFRRAFEEGLLAEDHSLHVGTRGPLYGPGDLDDDAGMGFRVITAQAFGDSPIADLAGRIAARVGSAPLYLSIDIDVLDPAHAPGTGTPEAGGLSTRELLGLLRGLVGLHLVGADVVEVAPAYDHAEITAVAASHVVYEVVALLARQEEDRASRGATPARTRAPG